MVGGDKTFSSWGSLQSHANWENNAVQSLSTLWPWPSPWFTDQKNLANSKIMKKKEGRSLGWPPSIPAPTQQRLQGATSFWRLVDTFQFSSVQFSRSVVSDSLGLHESQHARPPCPSPSPRVHSDSHPSSQWCHPAISSSVVPFSSCPQSLPASESFTVSQLFSWGGQNTGVSALASFLPKKS